MEFLIENVFLMLLKSLNSTPNDEFYNEEDILGKFNFGLTESVFRLEIKQKLFVSLEMNIKVQALMLMNVF